MTKISRDLYLAHKTVPISRLEIQKHFNQLSDLQKLYAHHMSRACWWGTRIVFAQVSPESPTIFNLFLHVFPKTSLVKKRAEELKAATGDSEAVDDFMWYFAQFLGNNGNYKSFGDTKFIPRTSEDAFANIIQKSGSKEAQALYQQCKTAMFSLNEDQLMLGYPKNHVSAYYSPDISKDEIDLVQEFLESKQINAYNTRLFKSNSDIFVVKMASAIERDPITFKHKGKTIQLVYGDYKEEMRQIVTELKKALDYADNDNQKKMLEKYIESFSTGNIDAHKDSQRYWIKDKSPPVEVNLGFIESYRDPAGVRGEWEGFVSTVNKDQTRKFDELVAKAPTFIEMLPWGPAFEKDKFHRPDFSSLEVLTFCTSGIPAGINIPNYDDIRQLEGFKNVSLGNVLNAASPNEIITFLNEKDKELFKQFKGKSFEVQVGIHELLGHGSGKLLEERVDGTFNFDRSNPPANPLTGLPISTWYKSGETFGSKFGSFASSYEECRAEACGIYLSTNAEILKIFGHEGQEAQDVLYINWLLMVRAGLLALEFYDPTSKNWGQAHMRARFAILRVLMKFDSSLVSIVPNQDFSDATIHLDRSKITSSGMEAIRKFLIQLQVFKATADVIKVGKELYDTYTSVPEDWQKLRDLVLKLRQPRKVFVQANTEICSNSVLLKEYEATVEGLLQSFVDRNV